MTVIAGPSALRCTRRRLGRTLAHRALHTWALQLRRDFRPTLAVDGLANLILAAAFVCGQLRLTLWVHAA